MPSEGSHKLWFKVELGLRGEDEGSSDTYQPNHQHYYFAKQNHSSATCKFTPCCVNSCCSLLRFKVFEALTLKVCHILRGSSTVTSPLRWRPFIVPRAEKSQRRNSFLSASKCFSELFFICQQALLWSFLYLRAAATLKFCRMLTHQLDWLMQTLGGSQKGHVFRNRNFYSLGSFNGCEVF